MEIQAPYELRIVDIDVEASDDGTLEVIVTFEGRHGPDNVRQMLKSKKFSDLFECCQLLAKGIFAKEFRLNSPVDFNFELTGEDGITVWHTHPSTFLKMPMNMHMQWSCHHLKSYFKSLTSLGLVEMPQEFRLVDGALPVKETLELMMGSMASGIEFMGMLVQQREQIDHDKEMAAAQG